jgi:hypothetical protein
VVPRRKSKKKDWPLGHVEDENERKRELYALDKDGPAGCKQQEREEKRREPRTSPR